MYTVLQVFHKNNIDLLTGYINIQNPQKCVKQYFVLKK